MLNKLFTAHPHSIGETYLQHTRIASWFFVKLFLASMAALLHAVFPFLFEHTASKMITDLYLEMGENRRTMP